jgi:rare lipoprotein A
MLAALVSVPGLVHAQAAPAAPASAPPSASTAPAAGTADASEGKIAWYGKRFNGRRTASGQRFDPNALTMAHKTLPFGTRVRLTNVSNRRSVVVRVNDRGPHRPELVGDVTYAAARSLRMLRSGVVTARLEVLGKR